MGCDHHRVFGTSGVRGPVGDEITADLALDVGFEATPTVARRVEREGADVGVVVTASHNPASDNGIKLRTASGRGFDEERNGRITRIVEAESFAFAAHDAIGAVSRTEDARAVHERVLRDSERSAR